MSDRLTDLKRVGAIGLVMAGGAVPPTVDFAVPAMFGGAVAAVLAGMWLIDEMDGRHARGEAQ